MARVLIFFVCLVSFAAQASPNILVMGDSLSAAYGVPKAQGWVSLLQQRLSAQSFPHQVINASISGETTEGGLRRLPQALDRAKPAVVLIELGANDGLRVQSLEQMRENLTSVIALSSQAGARVVLFEMRIPSNYGPTYTEAFTRTFAEVADDRQVPLVPFLLSAFAEDPDAFLSDGIHPSASAQPVILDTVWPHIEPLLTP